MGGGVFGRGVGDEFEGDGVDAVALAGGLVGGVVEEVAEVGAAGGAEDFGAGHAVGVVGVEDDAVAGGGGVEGGPAAAGVELGVGVEELAP